MDYSDEKNTVVREQEVLVLCGRRVSNVQASGPEQMGVEAISIQQRSLQSSGLTNPCQEDTK